MNDQQGHEKILSISDHQRTANESHTIPCQQEFSLVLWMLLASYRDCTESVDHFGYYRDLNNISNSLCPLEFILSVSVS